MGMLQDHQRGVVLGHLNNFHHAATITGKGMLDGTPFQCLYPSDLPPLPTAVTLEFFDMLDKFAMIALAGVHSDLPLLVAPVKLYIESTVTSTPCISPTISSRSGS
jgi:hypothetical protein